MLIIFTFFIVFIYSLPNGIMISNILFYLILLGILFRDNTVLIKKDIAKWYIFLVCWTLVSTTLYVLTENFDIRNILQFLFNLQYFLLFTKLNLNWDKFECWLFRFCLLLSGMIVLLFICTYPLENIPDLYRDGVGREWGEKFFPGWPNSIPIPLLFGLFLSIKKKSVLTSLLIIVAIVLTTSRGGLLGIVAILFYFNIYKKMTLNNFNLRLSCILISLLFLGGLFLNDILTFIYHYIPSLEYRLGVTFDRADIINITIQYMLQRPLLGYGGNTLDQIIPVFGNLSVFNKQWNHTHNWFFEMLLRYGIIGAILFSGFIFTTLLRIRNKDNQFMFFLIILLSCFQGFLREFNVIFLMAYLTIDSNCKIKKGTFCGDYNKKES